jgi:hypothetical protein
MVDAASAAKSFEGLGFERVNLIPGSTYQDSSTVLIVPTRGMIHHKAVSALQSIIAPMNQKRALLFCAGDEVGQAYDNMIGQILGNADLSKWKYVMTVEDDNLPPADAHIRLLESIEWGKYDAVSGIYFTKGDVNMPMAYGDPEEYAKTGALHFQPRDVRKALENGNIMEVNGIAMGCALWRMECFKKLERPWYTTLADVVPSQGAQVMTQDLAFCRKMRLAGMRMAVDFRVKVGHLDVTTGTVY